MRRRKKNRERLQIIAKSVVLSVMFVAAVFLWNINGTAGTMLLHEALPLYQSQAQSQQQPLSGTGGGSGGLFKWAQDTPETGETFAADIAQPAPADGSGISVLASEPTVQEVFSVERMEEGIDLSNDRGVIGLDDVILQPETDRTQTVENADKVNLTVADLDRLRDLQTLRNNFYIVDNRTDLTAADFDVDRFLATDLSIDNSANGPKILIFHTHSQEGYSDSNPDDPMDGITGAGERLAQILTDTYGIETLHHTGRYDIVDGKSHTLGAYERMEPEIMRILAENPSIQIAIDLHRDGVDESIRLVTEIDGKPTAQIMFFNGLSKLKENGVLSAIESLPNPYLATNLAFSFQMQMEANHLYPHFTRKVYLNAYRYSLNMLPKSLLVEVGAQTNTKAEAFNAMQPLARVLAAVIR